MAISIDVSRTRPGEFESLPTESAKLNNGKIERRHDLDALRAVAMLLGIILHAALAFAPIPWTVSDSQQSEFYGVLFAAIHGFRMPLFFLVSGFFTAMLWRKRGLGGLIKQRLKRIFLPLAIGCVTIIPAMWAVSYLAAQPSEQSDEAKVFVAAATGQNQTIRDALDSGIIKIDSLDPASGASLLTVATFCDQTETVRMLLEAGADPNQKNQDSGTPLHVAVFMGRVDSAILLIGAGANPETKDGNNMTPKDNLGVDFGTTNWIAQMYGQSLDEAKLKSNRTEIAALLGVDSAQVLDSESSGLDALYGLLFQLPVLMHLWFLAFLCWLVAAFAAYSWIAKVVRIDRLPKWLFCSPLVLVWAVPLTMLPQSFMSAGVFGPDSSSGLLPIPSVLGYYAIFFFFGAIYWDLDDTNGMLGRWWYISLPVALFVVFPIGLEIVSGTFGILPESFAGTTSTQLGSLFQSLFAWLMIFGSIGLFRALLSRENKTMRYISDSSYWLYLAHLPLVILAQWFVKDWQIPALVKFAAITVVVSAILLLTYEYLIRYTIIGSMLNGPRKRISVAGPNSPSL